MSLRQSFTRSYKVCKNSDFVDSKTPSDPVKPVRLNDNLKQVQMFVTPPHSGRVTGGFPVGGTRGSPCICFKKHNDATPCRAWRHVALFAPTVGMPVAGASSRRNSYHRHRMADRHEIAPDRAILPENVSIRNRRPVWWPRPEATGRPRPGFRPAAVGPVVRNGTPGQAGGDTSPRNMDERGQHSCRVWLAEHPGYKHGSGAGPGTAQTAPAGRIAG